MSGDVKPGYKQTEIGVIPEDWLNLSLGQIIGYVKGFAFKAIDYQSYGIRVIRVSDTTYDYIKDDEGVYIDETKARRFNKWALSEGDLIVSTVGSKPPMYDSMVGKATFVKSKDKGALLNQNAVILRSKSSSMATQIILHNHLKQDRYLTHIEKIFRGNANQASITLKELFEYPLPLPPTKAEQEAIAEALSDADALIESLTQLIAKKRQIKQGAMQELLRPKDDWVSHLLPQVCWFQEGPGVRNHQFTASGVKLFNGTNIEKGKIDLTKTDRYISEKEAFGWYSHFLANAGDIVIACSGISVDKFEEKVAVLESHHLPLCMNTSTMRFKVNIEKVSEAFFQHFLRSNLFKEQISGKATGSAQLNFGPSHVKAVTITIPAITEQNAIADILSDMDAEIIALETKLAKARQLKQGMMHNLLTGRIRLV